MKPFYAVLGFLAFILIVVVAVFALNNNNQATTQVYENTMPAESAINVPSEPNRVETHVIEREVAVPTPPKVIEKHTIERVPTPVENTTKDNTSSNSSENDPPTQ